MTKDKFWWRHKRACKRCQKPFIPRSWGALYCGNRDKKKGCQYVQHQTVVIATRNNPNRRRIWRSKTEEQKALRKKLRHAMNKIWMNLTNFKRRKESLLREGKCPFCTMFLTAEYHKKFGCQEWNTKNLSNDFVRKT